MAIRTLLCIIQIQRGVQRLRRSVLKKNSEILAKSRKTEITMDILTPHDGITNEKICKAQIEAVEKKQNEYKLIGRLTKIPGHTLYKFNTTTREASKVEMRADITRQYDPDTDTVVRHIKSNVKVEKNCYYEQALNMKNFIKRLRRRGCRLLSYIHPGISFLSALHLSV